MTDHARKDIREAVVAALQGTGDPRPTAAGVKVYSNRMEPLLRSEGLPVILVYSMRERVDAAWVEAPRRLRRIVSVAIEAAVAVTADVDDAMDAIAREIEVAMHADDTLGGNAAGSILTDTELDVMADGDRPCGAVRLTYDITYFTEAPDEADMNRDDLVVANIRHNVGGELAEADEAVDNLPDLDAPP